MRSAPKRWVRVLFVLSSLGVIFSADALMAHAAPAGADYVQALSVSSGGSATDFNIDLPSSAVCSIPTNKPGGDELDSFLVASSDVSADNVAKLTFSNPVAPVFGSYSGGIVVTDGGAPYSQVATLPVTGQVGSPPVFNFAAYDGAFASSEAAASQNGDPLFPGLFYMGIACVEPGQTATGASNPDANQIDGNDYWYVPVTFAASSTDPGGFTWSLTPFATAVALTASPASPAPPGAAVTFTATVTPSNAQGTVTFYQGSTAIGSPEPVTVTSGVASATGVVGTLPAGTDSVTAQFTPTAYNNAALTGFNTFGPSTSSALSYVIATSTTTTVPGATTTTVPGATTTTVPGATTTTVPGATTVPESSATTSPTVAGSTADSSSDNGGGSASAADPSGGDALADTGAPISRELLFASLIGFLGLFLLSLTLANPPQERQALVWPDDPRAGPGRRD